MGLLDDAIREHLDLKRKHGAKEDELRRQETEALGPARRDFTGDRDEGAAPAAADAEEAAPAATQGPVAEPAGWLDDEAPFAAAAEAPPPAPLEPAAEVTEPPMPDVGEPPATDEPLPAPDPAPVVEDEPAPERRESHTPTQGFDALSLDEEAPEGGDEDVLEETPDFLQDTPEHDRLWFEQKPPRDFDFDD
jgi:hypothetical protein